MEAGKLHETLGEMSAQERIPWQKIKAAVIFMLIGAVCGALGGYYIDSILQDKTPYEALMVLALFFLVLMAAAYLQIIIHETGHLICGILTGYKFSSFRIGSLMWLKENERVTLKRFSLAGTGGQCLMIPPDMVEGKFPFVLYNLGGSLLNIVSGLLFLGLAALCQNITYLAAFLLLAGIIGFAFALINGIPLRLGIVDNDGRNALSLRKSSEAARSFWLQLNMNGQIARGMRLKDMPNEWFYVPSDDEMKNSMTAAMGAVYCSLLMDTHSFEEAYQLMDRWLEMDSAIVELRRNLMNCDRIYCELIGKNREEQLAGMLNKRLKKFMKFMQNFPSVLRTEYAYALLAEKDTGKAEKIKTAFEKRTQTYPYQSEIESERELMNIVESCAAKI